MIPDSSLVSYVSPQDFLIRRDIQSIRQYVSDDPGNPVIDGALVLYVVSPGTGFSLPPTIIIDPPPYPGVPAQYNAIVENGSISKLFIPVKGGIGSGYVSTPNVVASGGGGTGFVIGVSISLVTNPIVIEELNIASGMLESAALRSNMYAVSDLQSLNGVGLSYLKTIVSDLAMFGVMSRRPGPAPSETITNAYNNAITALEALANGTRIFGFIETQQAGLPTVYQMQPYDYAQNNFLAVRYPRMFGQRQIVRRWL